MSPFDAALIFSAVIIAIEALVLIIRGRGYGPLSVRLIGISVVVLAGLILALADIPAQQRSAAYALLGVAFGYLAGKPAGQGDG
jgi:hypothetical protein